MNSDLFYHWFTHHFLQYTPPSRPLLLLLDGHSAHYSPATIKLAAENQVIVFVLPPNTTHVAQPLDRGCFSPLKAAWRKYCHEFRSKNPGRVVTRYEFCQIFSKAWYKAMTGSNIVSKQLVYIHSTGMHLMIWLWRSIMSLWLRKKVCMSPSTLHLNVPVSHP